VSRVARLEQGVWLCLQGRRLVPIVDVSTVMEQLSCATCSEVPTPFVHCMVLHSSAAA
jgi:hypothetical protein